MHSNWKLFIFFGALFVLAFGGYFVLNGKSGTASETVTPRSGNILETRDEIAVFPAWDLLSPASFPLLLDGEAPGPWYFEASFPLEVQTPDGTVVGRGFTTAQDEWMTEAAVPFYGEVQLVNSTAPYTGQATLILRKANASGLPEHEGAFTMPITITIN